MRHSLSSILIALGLLSSAFAQEPGIDFVLSGKSAIEKANIKADRIIKSNPKGIYEKPGIRVEIQSITEIPGGVELYAKAWKNGKQIGFGADGTIETERFRFINPPVLVLDPNGEIVRTYFDEEQQKTFISIYHEDPKQALRDALIDTIRIVGKGDQNIISGKIGNTVTTCYPNPDVESTSVDGSVALDNGASWAAARDAADGSQAQDATGGPASIASVGDDSADGTVISIIRGFHLCDTSSIPDTDTVSAATFSLWITTIINQDNDGFDYWNLYTSTPASDTAIGTPDYDQIGRTAQATAQDIGSVTTGQYNDLTITTLSLISKTGITKTSVQIGHDAENHQIAGSSYNRISGYFSDNVGSTNDPKFVITHSAAAPAAPGWRKLPPGGGDIFFY